MANIKLSPGEWAQEVERALRRSEIVRKKRLVSKLQRFLPVPIIIGVVAAILLITFYGWRDFFLRVLSATIAATIVTTMIAAFARMTKD